MIWHALGSQVKCFNKNHELAWNKWKNRNLSKQRYKEEPNKSFRIEKYTWNKKIGEWAQEQNRENNQWTGKQTYINLSDREER